MLEQEQIVKNIERLTSALNSVGVDTESIYKVVGENIISAPLNSTNTYYGAFDGGLVDHLLRVATYAVKINKLLPEGIQQDQNSVIKTAMLHKLGLVDMFVPNKSEWHVKNLGKVYEFAEKEVSMRTAERTIRILTNSEIQLTDYEFQAIMNYDKEDDLQSKYHNGTLGQVLKTAIMLATEEEKGLLNAK